VLDGVPTGGMSAARTDSKTESAATPVVPRDPLEALRRAVAAIERGGFGADAGPVLSTGLAALDRALPQGGLAQGTVHEVGGLNAAGFVLHLLSRTRGQVLWAVPDNLRDTLYGPGLAQAGVDVGRLAIAPCATPEDLLWVTEEALKSSAAQAVVAQPAKQIDLTASRRLQLAAEAGGALGLILTDPTPLRAVNAFGSEAAPSVLAPSAVTTRWQIDPAPLKDGLERASWTIRLLRVRGAGVPDAGWTVRIDRDGRMVGSEFPQ